MKQKIVFYTLIITLCAWGFCFADLAGEGYVPRFGSSGPVVINLPLDASLFTGEAFTSVPIFTLPATADIQDKLKLALEYRSGGSNTWVGKGWELEPGYITRINKFGANKSNNPYLLCLNGETHELVSIGTDKYRTKIEIFKRIEFDGSAWHVWARDGTEYKFGTSSGGRWVLTRITDTHGICITLSYDRPSSEEIYLSEINYPVKSGLTAYCKIKFVTESRQDDILTYYYGTSYRVNQRLKEIQVLAESRLQKKYILTYTTDGSSQVSFLSSITEYGKNGTALPATSFLYQQPISSNSTFQPASQWANVTDPFVLENAYLSTLGTIPVGLDIGVIDLNGDNLPDLVGCRSKTIATWPYVSYEWIVRLGNGSSFSTKEYVWLSAEQSCHTYNINGVHIAQYFTLARGTTLADINRDGLPDLIYRKYDGGSVSSGGAKATYYISSTFARYNTGNGFSDTETKILDWSDSYYDLGNSLFILIIGENVLLVDMNGDGLPDLVYNKHHDWIDWGGVRCSASDWMVRLNTGSGFSKTEKVWLSYDKAYFAYEHPDLPISRYRFDPINILNTMLVDLNNDGLLDLVYNNFVNCYQASYPFIGTIYTSSYNWKVRYNTGSSFSNTAITLISEAPHYFYKVSASSPAAKSVKIGENGTFADVNGDGLPDLVFNKYENDVPEHPSVSWMVYLNLGDQFSSAKNLLGSLGYYYNGTASYGNVCTYNSYLTDMNKDGVADLVYPKFTSLEAYNIKFKMMTCLNKNTPAADLLKRQTSVYGGVTNIEYVSSANFDNTGADDKNDLLFVMPVVKKITKNPGVGKSGSTIYSYDGGQYDIPNRQFRGFRHVQLTDPLGHINHTYFHQDNARLGKIERQQNPITKILNEYKTDSTAPYFTPLIQVDEYTDSKCRRTAYSYDNYGNVTKTNYYGDIDKTGDEKSVLADFSINSSDWLISFPSRERVFSDLDGGGSLAAETQYLYDNNTSYTNTLTKGDLTKVRRSLDSKAIYLETSSIYNGYGLETSRTDARNYTTSIEYDSVYDAFPVKITNPKGHIERMAYNSPTSATGIFGQLRSKVDENGNEALFEYDQFGRKTKVIGPYDGSSTYGSEAYEYSIGGPGANYILTRTTEENGTPNHLIKIDVFDGFERVIQTAKESKDTQLYSYITTLYNERGEIENTSLPYFQDGGLHTSYVSPGDSVKWTQHLYDAIGRIAQIIKPDSTTISNSYSGWITTIIDENGHQKEFTKDAYGRLANVKEKNGLEEYSTDYKYNTLDDLTLITDHAGNKFEFGYDSLRRRTRMVDPDLGSWSYDYDNNDNLVKSTNGNGKIINYTYDEINRILTKDFADTLGTETAYVYDEIASTNGIGRKTSMRDLSGSCRWNYDKEGRVLNLEKTIDGSLYKVEWEYDAMSRAKNVTLPNLKEIHFTYNNGGSINNIDGYVLNVDYDASGKQTRIDFSNPMTSRFEYYADNHRLKEISTGALQDLNYEYDSVGNVSKITDAVRGFTKTYNYDELDRLLDGDGNSYEYNAIGNIVKFNSKDYLYSDIHKPHAVTADGINSYSYDGCGNMVSGAGRSISYDSENRPITIIRNGETTRFVYDGNGKRVKKVVSNSSSTTTTIYIEDLYEKETTQGK